MAPSKFRSKRNWKIKKKRVEYGIHAHRGLDTENPLHYPFKRLIKSLLPFANIIRRFNVYGYVHLKYIPIYIQQDATLQVYLYLETALHVSGGTSTHHQGRIQLYLQHLVFVTPLLLSAAIVQ